MKSHAGVCVIVALLLSVLGARISATEVKRPDASRRVVVRAEVPREMGETGARVEAAREACWRVFSGLVASTTLVRLSRLEQDDIRTRLLGFVRPVRVIQTGAQGDVWIYEAEFEANLAQIAREMRTWWPFPDPRVMVVLPERVMGTPAPDPVAETEILNQLIKAGFKVIDQKRSAELRQGDLDRLRDPKIAAELARRMGADIFVTGEAFAEQGAGSALRPSCEARVELRAIVAETADVVVADVARGSSAADTPAAAAKAALQRVAGLLADHLVTDLLLMPGRNSRKLKLQVGIFKGFTDADDFEEALKKLPGVDRVSREDYTEHVATFEVEIHPEFAKTLPRLLEKDPSMVPFNLRVKSWTVTGGRAEVQ